MVGEVASSYNERAPSRKAFSKKGQNQVKSDFDTAKGNKNSHRSMWVSKRLEDATSETKHYFREVRDIVESAWASNRTRTKDVDKVDVGWAGSLKKTTKSKYDSIKCLDIIHKEYPDLPPSKSAKKNVQEKRRLDDDTEVLDDQPKKSKQVIWIDRNDISNKRLDDGVVINESAIETKNDLEEKTKMSMNAQFRSIQPSPSILSYVEDNLLGRRSLIELRRAGYNTELSAPLDNIPFSTSSERERIEENIFRKKMTFFVAAKLSSSFPPPGLPEIAFAGRSNVGKSSLLNLLTRQWGAVRTSDKPALTQTINFFELGSKLCLVDLPGHGFAYAKEEVKDAWEEFISMQIEIHFL
ncbi:putative gtp-binding protein engb [Fagus crenata]